jgi:ABC-type uncharacterized transport system permease subunit
MILSRYFINPMEHVILYSSSAETPLMFAALLAYALASLLYVSGTKEFFRKTGNICLLFGASCLAVVARDLLAIHGDWRASAAPILAAVVGTGAIIADRALGVRLAPAMLAPFGMLLLLVRFFAVPDVRIASWGVGYPWLTGTHVTLAIAGQALAIAACVLSILFLWQHQALKRRKMADIIAMGEKVPSLARLDHWLRVTLIAGFVMLTLSLLTGAVFIAQIPGGLAENVPDALKSKVLWAVAVWSWYLGTLVAKNILRSPARVVARMSVGGFSLMALAWFGLVFFSGYGPVLAG